MKPRSKKKEETEKGEVRTMTVLFSDLLVPGWAEGDEAKIGLDGVTARYGNEHAFTLPCHNSDPELFFSDDQRHIAIAKSLCSACPMKSKCLEGAISRQEPCGVWGGELFEEGEVIAQKRMPGRPRINRELVASA